MTSLSYRLPAKLPETRAPRPHGLQDRITGDCVHPPADGFTHDGKLNMGPALLLAVALSLSCWGGVFGIGYMLLR